jgi:DNA primase
MPRIPDQDLKRLKEEASVARLVEASGVELKKAGKDQIGRCPFHDDRQASLVVSGGKNLWHCFVSCPHEVFSLRSARRACFFSTGLCASRFSSPFACPA